MAKQRSRRSESVALVPVALTIAGSDCSAGAGIQADLKTFAALGVYGLTAVTCVVAEIPGKVSRIEAVTPRIVRDQIEVLLKNFQVGAIKTGLLCSAADRFRCGTEPFTTTERRYPARDRSGNDCDQRRPASGTRSYRRLQKQTVSARDRSSRRTWTKLAYCLERESEDGNKWRKRRRRSRSNLDARSY